VNPDSESLHGTNTVARVQTDRSPELTLHARKYAGVISQGAFPRQFRRWLWLQLGGLRIRHGAPCETQIRFLQRGPDFDAAAKAIQFLEQQHNTPEQADDRQLLDDDHGDVAGRVDTHAYFFRP
jgi:hypothetical protein